MTTDSFATVESLQTPRFSDVLRYSQSGKRYTFIDQSTPTNGGFGEQLDLSMTFGPGDAVASNSNQQKTVFQRVCSGFPAVKVTYTSVLTLFNPGSANPVLALNYASYGSLAFNNVTAVGQRFLYRPFGYGLPTNAAGLNRTGVVTYRGLVDGWSVTDQNFGAQTAVTGTLVLTVDFTLKTFTAVVDLGSDGSFTFQQSGGADLSKLVGTSSKGNLAGFLAGPAAEEAAITVYTTVDTSPTVIKLSGAAKR